MQKRASNVVERILAHSRKRVAGMAFCSMFQHGESVLAVARPLQSPCVGAHFPFRAPTPSKVSLRSSRDDPGTINRFTFCAARFRDSPQHQYKHLFVLTN